MRLRQVKAQSSLTPLTSFIHNTGLSWVSLLPREMNLFVQKARSVEAAQPKVISDYKLTIENITHMIMLRSAGEASWTTVQIAT